MRYNRYCDRLGPSRLHIGAPTGPAIVPRIDEYRCRHRSQEIAQGAGTGAEMWADVMASAGDEEPSGSAGEVLHDPARHADRVGDGRSRRRGQTVLVGVSLDRLEVLVGIAGRSVVAREVSRPVEISGDRFVHGHDPERRLHPARPAARGGHQRLGIVDAVHRDDDVCGPGARSGVGAGDHHGMRRGGR